MSQPFQEAPVATTEQTASAISMLLIQLGGEYYGIASANVREIVRYRPWTLVPGAPHELPGIIAQRGQILPIVDPRALLGHAEGEIGRSARFVVIQYGEVDMALLVEAVIDLVDINEATIDHSSAGVDVQRGRLVRSLALFDEKPVALLDFDGLIGMLREGE